MTDKQIIIDVCPYQGECSVNGCKRNDDSCFVRQLFEERYRAENQIVELNKMVEAKEQECEELKETLKTKAKGWANVNDKILEEVDQLKAELEAYKMEAEEGKEINAELKAENEELKKKVESYVCSTNCYKYKEADQLKADNKHLNDLLNQALKELEQSREAIEKIKEIANNTYCLTNYTNKDMAQFAKQILQICDEVNE